MLSGVTGWTGSLAGTAQVRFTDATDGDMAAGAAGLEARRRDLSDRSWVRLRMVHGARVVTVAGPGDGDLELADAAVTASPDVVLSVATADCAALALASPTGVVGVAHVGWRGLVAGIVEAVVEAMAAMGATDLEAVIGPCIEAACYPWQEADLAAAVAARGPAVSGRSADGGPAFDLPGGIHAALGDLGVAQVHGPVSCTACQPGLWSWRARRDPQRQAVLAWLS